MHTQHYVHRTCISCIRDPRSSPPVSEIARARPPTFLPRTSVRIYDHGAQGRHSGHLYSVSCELAEGQPYSVDLRSEGTMLVDFREAPVFWTLVHIFSFNDILYTEYEASRLHSAGFATPLSPSVVCRACRWWSHTGSALLRSRKHVGADGASNPSSGWSRTRARHPRAPGGAQ